MEQEVKLKTLFIEIDQDIHHQIKIRSLERRLSMKQYVMQAVIQRIADEKKYE